MANPQHIEWLREGVESWNERRRKTPFDPDLSYLDLKEVLPQGEAAPQKTANEELFGHYLQLQNFSLEGLNLSGANLSGSSFDGAWIPDADLSYADLSRTSFRYAQLDGSDLRFANLYEADLNMAFMTDCDLRGAKFSNTYVRGALVLRSDVSSFFDESGELSATNIRGMKALYPSQFKTLKGDEHTLIHSRFLRPESWKNQQNTDDAQTALTTPIVKASSIDISISDQGIDAFVQPDHGISDGDLGFVCRQKLDALKDNTRDIAGTISNKLGENTRADLTAYHRHLRDNDPANPHRLDFLARSIAMDMADPFVSEGFDNRLSFQLADFQRQHLDFLKTCRPEAAAAIREKSEAQLSRTVSKEEATDILDRLEASILDTEAAMESMVDVLKQLREVDDNLNAFAVKVFSDSDKEKLAQAVEAETKELATLGARIYWRGREALETVRTVGGDAAIMATLTGTNVPQVAQKIVTSLEPLMHKLAQLLTVLPPV